MERGDGYPPHKSAGSSAETPDHAGPHGPVSGGRMENGHNRIMVDGRTVTTVPSGEVPTPTLQYRAFRAEQRLVGGRAVAPTVVRAVPAPPPLAAGSRALIYKQDPATDEIGVRKTYLPGHVLTGPRDARIRS